MLNTSNQKTFIILIAFFLVLLRGVTFVFADEVLEDFAKCDGKMITDDDWKSRNGDPNQVYKFEKEGENVFLRAVDKGSSVQLFRKKGWRLRDNPVLTWSWRVNEFPKKANELNGNNDSAAGVYVVFPQRWFVPESIKYVWSEKLPVGTVIKRRDHFPLLVIRSGADEKGKWITEERNVYDDYKMLFDNRGPSDPVAFGMLTDANDTKSISAADYDSFRAIPEFSKKEEPKPETKSEIKTTTKAKPTSKK